MSKGLAGPLVFTLYWCGITGVFVGIVAWSFVKNADVKARFRPVEGTVVASKVERHSGDENDTYSPLIKYRYTVAGREYTAKRYAYGMWSSSDSGSAHEIVNAHPPGTRVTVYYDPDDPSKAVLNRETQEFLYFIVLFLQPFVMVGLGMIGYTATLPARNRRLRGFLESEPQTPWTIPTWGTLLREMAALSIRSRGHTPLLAVAMGYGLTAFLGTFAAAGLCFGLGWPFRPVVGAFLAGAAGIGLIAGAASWLGRGRARLEIDRNLGRLTVVSAKRNVEAKLSEIAGWRVRRVPNTHKVRSSGDSGLAPLLAAVRADGVEIPVHVFAADANGRVIADKAAAGLAELTGKPVVPAGGSGAEDSGDPKAGSILDAVRMVHKDQGRARQEYADLT